MISNLEKYKNDLNELTRRGDYLYLAIAYENAREEFEKQYKKALKEKYEEFIKKIPNFSNKYQQWYSEALVLLKQILPDRVDNFISFYEKPKVRKEVNWGNYVIADCLQGLRVTYMGDVKVDASAAIKQFEQQLNIIKSVNSRFESSLFDIQQLMQADLFDSELEAAKELNKKGFTRGAGAVAGVVLEKHLSEVCDNHNVKIIKKNPTINDYNQSIKDTDIIEVKDWRFIQRLVDLRNLCDHDKKIEPKKEDIEELIAGVEKISKTIF